MNDNFRVTQFVGDADTLIADSLTGEIYIYIYICILYISMIYIIYYIGDYIFILIFYRSPA